MLCSLNTLLTSVLADTTTGLRHNARRELLAQSVGQIVVGLAGGMAGSASVGGTVAAVQAGARRWAALTAGLLLLLLLLFAGQWGNGCRPALWPASFWPRRSTCWRPILWPGLRRHRTRLDAAVAVLVTGVTLGYDLMAAVLVGLGIAILLFIRAQSQVPIIHRRLTATERPSVRQRPADQAELLARHGDRIVMYQLRGTLFFAKTDQLFEEMLPDLDRPAWVILHLRRVIQIDFSSVPPVATNRRAAGTATAANCCFAKCARIWGWAGMSSAPCASSACGRGRLNVKTFAAADQALEYAENALLNALGVAANGAGASHRSGGNGFVPRHAAEQIAALAAVLRPRELDRGERLFAAGDGGAELYLVLRGRVDIRLPATGRSLQAAGDLRTGHGVWRNRLSRSRPARRRGGGGQADRAAGC